MWCMWRGGFTCNELAQLVVTRGFMKREGCLAAARDPSFVRDLAPGAQILEGFLFPATYHFPRHPTPQDAVASMVHHFREVWPRVAPTRPLDGRTVEQLVTLASLVERETAVTGQRPIVAAAFAKPLPTPHNPQIHSTLTY